MRRLFLLQLLLLLFCVHGTAGVDEKGGLRSAHTADLTAENLFVRSEQLLTIKTVLDILREQGIKVVKNRSGEEPIIVEGVISLQNVEIYGLPNKQMDLVFVVSEKEEKVPEREKEEERDLSNKEQGLIRSILKAVNDGKKSAA